MQETSFVGNLNKDFDIIPEDNVFHSIWNEYERVLIQSLITAFALDFLVKDQHGGDVDTVNNVRKIGSDPLMKYKNATNEDNYNARGDYDSIAYHTHEGFMQTKRNARNAFDKDGTKVADAYVDGNVLIPRNNKTIPRKNQGQLDHVLSAHEIHNDRGRVLAGLDGVDLANDPSNLRFTNADLNLNKRDMTVEEYIKWCEDNLEKVNQGGKKGEPLSDEVKAKLREEYKRAKKEYDAKIAKKYYTSPQFIKDTATVAAKRGAEMGIRQALGYVFMEIWFCAKEELQAIPAGRDLDDIISAIGVGIKRGLESARRKYKEIIAKIEEGFVAGALSSLTTTLCNFFFTTAKNIVRYIRQAYASVVQAGKVLFFNPDGLLLGDRIKSTAVILSTGASVIAGTAVGDLIAKTPIGMLPEVGQIVITFCSSLVSGLLSCSLLIFMDRSKYINSVVNKLNEMGSRVNSYREMADALETISAELAGFDIKQFRKDVSTFEAFADDVTRISDYEKLNQLLGELLSNLKVEIPWDGDFDSFMQNKNNRLRFS
ncbi:hypothetical protein [Butyrivibrio sp. WCD3002]|uniref:hypothetical protein n=1 Tax=Butyrivibrio sp. WCD3002 TaxID=1280676 RepID=UPI00041732A3|nr:hypothetical protein [Butyrivibrio sp. WCD3002]